MSFDEFFQIYATVSCLERSRIEDMIDTGQEQPFCLEKDYQSFYNNSLPAQREQDHNS